MDQSVKEDLKPPSRLGSEEAMQRVFLDIAGVGYPGFAHVADRARRKDPAQVMLDALIQPDLEIRLVEALPWIAVRYPQMNWPWLISQATGAGMQNRLGYIMHLAQELAKAIPETVSILRRWEREIEQVRLPNEGTLCRDSMGEPERQWLRSNRPESAAHWNLLTSLTSDELTHAHIAL